MTVGPHPSVEKMNSNDKTLGCAGQPHLVTLPDGTKIVTFNLWHGPDSDEPANGKWERLSCDDAMRITSWYRTHPTANEIEIYDALAASLAEMMK